MGGLIDLSTWLAELSWGHPGAHLGTPDDSILMAQDDISQLVKAEGNKAG